jgi:hypothetical protein
MAWLHAMGRIDDGSVVDGRMLHHHMRNLVVGVSDLSHALSEYQLANQHPQETRKS